MRKNLTIAVIILILTICVLWAILYLRNSGGVDNLISSPVSLASKVVLQEDNSSDLEPIMDTYSYKILLDDTGMKYKVDGLKYSGVTAINIYKNEGVIFSMKGVDGVGNNRKCNGIYILRIPPSLI